MPDDKTVKPAVAATAKPADAEKASVPGLADNKVTVAGPDGSTKELTQKEWLEQGPDLLKQGYKVADEQTPGVAQPVDPRPVEKPPLPPGISRPRR